MHHASCILRDDLLRPVARLGGDEYATLGRVFEMARPRVESGG